MRLIKKKEIISQFYLPKKEYSYPSKMDPLDQINVLWEAETGLKGGIHTGKLGPQAMFGIEKMGYLYLSLQNIKYMIIMCFEQS